MCAYSMILSGIGCVLATIYLYHPVGIFLHSYLQSRYTTGGWSNLTLYEMNTVVASVTRSL